MSIIYFIAFILSINLSTKVFSCERSRVNVEENLKDVHELLLKNFSPKFNPQPCELEIEGKPRYFMFYPLAENDNCGLYISTKIYNKFYRIMKQSMEDADVLREELTHWKKEISIPERSLIEDPNIFSLKLIHKTSSKLYIYFGTFPGKSYL